MDLAQWNARAGRSNSRLGSGRSDPLVERQPGIFPAAAQSCTTQPEASAAAHHRHSTALFTVAIELSPLQRWSALATAACWGKAVRLQPRLDKAPLRLSGYTPSVRKGARASPDGQAWRTTSSTQSAPAASPAPWAYTGSRPRHASELRAHSGTSSWVRRFEFSFT